MERDSVHGAKPLMRIAFLGAAALTTACLLASPGPTGDARLVAQSLTRSQIRSMPIEQRPNRPIHFYGNAVRRRYHREPPVAPVRPAPVRPAPAR